MSERPNQLDLQINLLTEQENTKMLKILERIAEKAGARTDDALKEIPRRYAGIDVALLRLGGTRILGIMVPPWTASRE